MGLTASALAEHGLGREVSARMNFCKDCQGRVYTRINDRGSTPWETAKNLYILTIIYRKHSRKRYHFRILGYWLVTVVMLISWSF